MVVLFRHFTVHMIITYAESQGMLLPLLLLLLHKVYFESFLSIDEPHKVVFKQFLEVHASLECYMCEQVNCCFKGNLLRGVVVSVSSLGLMAD